MLAFRIQTAEEAGLSVAALPTSAHSDFLAFFLFLSLVSLSAEVLTFKPAHFRADPAKIDRESKVVYVPLGPGQSALLDDEKFDRRGLPALTRGIYRVAVSALASHEGVDAAFFMSLRVSLNECGFSFGANDFPEAVKETSLEGMAVLTQPGPVQVGLAFHAADGFGGGWTLYQAGRMAQGRGGPKPEVAIGEESPGEEEGGEDDLNELDRVLNPQAEAFFAVREVRIERVAAGPVPSNVRVGKILYQPGETLNAAYTVTLASDEEEEGLVKVFLESELEQRVLLKEETLRMKPGEPRAFTLTAKLPEEELGYGLVVEGWSGGKRVWHAEDVFNIARSVYRVAIHGPGGPGMIATTREGAVQQYEGARALWSNCFEVFAWAPCDFSEMTPESEVWYSGQTCYQMYKPNVKLCIEAGHAHGIQAITYGKYIASGCVGWKFAMENPYHFKGNFFFPAGQWEPTNVAWLDSMREGDYHHPGQKGWFYQEFLPINPDTTPEMVDFSSKEILASAKMFGWDGVRWDGHPSGPAAIARTKEVIQEGLPNFVFGYNMMPSVTDYGWAVENFELDEICRGGGLVMNEEIRNAYRPFPEVMRILQVGGDLCRERGGCYLGISQDQVTPRDDLCMAALWYAAGCRPMGGVSKNAALNRFATRYSAFVFDERMRRLADPEKVLTPRRPTDLWWTPFVYEVPRGDGRSFLVANLLNLPQEESVIKEPKEYRWRMRPKASDASEFELRLPEGYRAERAALIDPRTLRRDALDLDGQAVSVPAVSFWKQLVVEMRRAPGTKTLAELYGPPVTFGVRKDGRKIEGDAAASSSRGGQAQAFQARPPRVQRPEAAPMLDRNRRLLEQRLAKDVYLGLWSRHTYLDQDDAGRQTWKTPEDFTVRRDGRLDVLVAKGIWYHVLRLDEAALRLDAYRERECLLGGRGGFSDSSGWYNLSGYPGPEELQRMDAVLFLNIPAVAVSSAQRFQLRDYVQGGGGFLLAGGQWAFGKGLTAYTVLEDVLPVTVVQNVDVHFFETHAALEPGPDAAEMFPKDLDWSPGPLVECYNEVAIKDGAKVFLQCGSVPILAGWTFGRGRVLAFLACAMGSAPARRQMFWEWPEWPRVAAAMLQWLAPDFRQTQSAERMESGQSPADEKKLEEIVERLTLSGEAELGAAEGPSGRAGSESSEASEALDVALPGGGETARASGPIEQDLATLSRCLSRSKLTPELARSCADAAVITLARTEGVSESVRESVLAAAARYPNPEWAAAAQPLLQKMDPEIKGLGYRITAISGADGAAQSVAKGLQDPDDLVRIDVLLALASSDSPAAVPEVAAVLERIDRSERDREAGQVFNDLNPWTLQVSWEEELMRMASIFYLYRAGKDAHAERQAYATLRMRYYLKVMDRHIAGIYAGMFNQPRSVVVSMQRLARQAEWVRRNMARLHEKQVEQVLSDGPHQLERFAPALTRAHWLDEVRLALQIAAAAVDARNFRAVSPLLEAKNRVLRTLALQQILSRGDEQDLKKALEKLQGMADRTGEEDLLFCLEHIGMFNAETGLKVLSRALSSGRMESFRLALHRLAALPSEPERVRLLELAVQREEHELRDLAMAWKASTVVPAGK